MNTANPHTSSTELRWANGYAEFMIRHRRVVMVIILILTITGSLFVKDLNMRNDPDTLLPE